MIDELLDAEGEGMVDIKKKNEPNGFSAITIASILPDREVVLDKLLSKAAMRDELEEILEAKCTSGASLGADGTISKGAERTALMYAIDSENTASAKKLLDSYKHIHGKDPERAMELACVKSANDATALIIAIDEKNADVVDALVDLLDKAALKEKYRAKVLAACCTAKHAVLCRILDHSHRSSPVLSPASQEPITLAIRNANVPELLDDGTRPAYLPESSVEKMVAVRFQSMTADQNDSGDDKLLSGLLDDAINFSLFNVAAALLKQGAKPSKPSTAAAAGDIDFFEKEDNLNNGTINQIHLADDDSGSTYLMLACRAGSVDFVSYLLDRYSEHIVADVKNRDTGDTAIITAARGGHVQIVKKLLTWAMRPSQSKRYKASLPVKNKKDPLEIVEKDQTELSPGDRLNIDVQSNDGTNLLMALCSISSSDPVIFKEQLDVLELLSRVMSEHFQKRLERKWAAENQGKEMRVSSKGASPMKIKELKKEYANLTDQNNDTALDLAVRRDAIELASALKLSWGAVVSFRSAAVIGSITDFRVLVDAATAVSDYDPRDLFTALHLACRSTLQGSADKAIMLLERSADPSLQTRDGWTPLMFACLNASAEGKVETVQALLDNHADTDLQNSDGCTALMLTLKDRLAFSPRQMLVAAMLVGAGADLYRVDLSGYCALEDCSRIAGEALDPKGDEVAPPPEIFATMINRGVHLTSLGHSIDEAVRRQRGFILPDFDLDEMKESGMSVVTNPTEASRIKTSIILRAYAAMEPEEIARCATYIFVHDGLFVAMMKGMWLAQLADSEARRVQALDENHAGSLSALSDRIQLSVAGLLCVEHDASGSQMSAQDLCVLLNGAHRTSLRGPWSGFNQCHPALRCCTFDSLFFSLEKYSEGQTVLVAASKYEMKAVLAHPEIQRYSERLWWGWMHTDLKQKGVPQVVIAFVLVFTLIVQIVLSPLIALFPFLGRSKHKRLAFLSHYFFGVPVIDFLSASLWNTAFLVMIMVTAEKNMYRESGLYMWGLALWALADFWSELLELSDGFTLASIRREVLALVNANYRSEYTIDPFNAFDLISSACATIGLFWYNIFIALNVDNVDRFYDNTTSIAFQPMSFSRNPSQVALPDAFYETWTAQGLRCLLTLSVFFGWMRMLRVLSMSETMGPFVLMFLNMISDIVQWLILLVVVLASSSSALFMVHALGKPKTWGFDCDAAGTPFVGIASSFVKMIEGSLIGEPCKRELPRFMWPVD